MDRIHIQRVLQRLNTDVARVFAARGLRPWMFLLVLFAVFYLIGLGLYYPGLMCPMVYDSQEWINARAHIFERHDVWEVISIVPVRPLFMLTLYGNFLLWGMDAFFFRLVNLAFLAAAGTVLFHLIALVYETPAAGVKGSTVQKQVVALVLALFFVMHPLQSYVVLYIWQREAILACLFYFASLTGYLAVRMGRFARPPTGYAITGLLFLAGLTCKENVITAPFVMLLADLTLFGQSLRQLVSRALTIGLITLPGLAVYTILTQRLFGLESEVTEGILNRLHFYYSEAGLTVLEVLMTECRVVFHYLASIVLPVPGTSTIAHAMTISTSLFTPLTTAPACLAVAGIISVGIALIRRRPLISFGILFFFLSLAPESLLIPQYLSFSYRAILPMAALLLIVGGGVLSWERSDRHEEERRYFSVALGAVTIVVTLGLGVATYVKAKDWNPLSLWKEAYERLPTWSRSVEKTPYVDILTNLSGILANKGETAKAMSLCRLGLSIEPDQGMLHNNMGVALLHSGQVEEAVEHLKKSVELRPGSLIPLNNLGNALLGARRIPEAIEAYRKSVLIGPHRVQPYLNMGAAFLQLKRYDEAVRILERAVAVDPGHPKVRANLGIALLRVGRFPEAVTHLSKSVQIDPNLSLSHYHLGIAWENLGETARAAEGYTQTVGRAPNWAEGHLALARVMMKLDNISTAIGHYRRALRLDPKNFAAHNDLAGALVRMSEFEEAAKHAKTALELKPGFPEAEENLRQALEGTREGGPPKRKVSP